MSRGIPALRQAMGSNLRTLRESHRLSQAGLADLLRETRTLGWAAATVAEVEAGRRNLRVDEVLLLALFFEVSAHELIVPSEDLRGLDRDEVDHTLDRETVQALLRPATSRGRSLETVALPRTRTVGKRKTDRALRTPQVEQEEEAWLGLGGSPRVLRTQRNRLWRGEITRHQYAAWKRHAMARLGKGRGK